MDPTIYTEIVNYKSRSVYPPNATKEQKYVIRRRCSTFQVVDGQLFHVSKMKDGAKRQRKVVIGPEEANQIFTEFHASAIGSHCGIHKTKDAISKRFFWPGMGVDIEKWVSQCKNCQLSRVTLKQEPVHIPITVHSPFELVGMDLIGKLTMTTRGNQYICVMIDYYTKWTEAFAIPNKTAEKVTECIVQFFYRFGAPKRILTDQGKEFVNQWDPSRYKIILGVVNDQHHWFLVVMYPYKRKTLLLDSMGESELKLRKCLERTRAFMRKKGIEVSRWTCETVPHPLQQDGTSCGVFALKFADQVLAAKPLTFPSDTSSINALVWDMAVTLLRESDDISSLCHVCGETATNDKSAAEDLWIACDRCGRWFHTSCVDNPALDKEYMCTACVRKLKHVK